jgi:hypothetical protein
MKRLLPVLAFAFVFSGIAVSQQFPKVTAKAIWAPGVPVLQDIRDHCGKTPNEPFADCFYSMMQKSGASPEALAFTRQTGNAGYLRDFQDLGPVGVAFVQFPSRANENQGAFIVNGTPAMIDIDQQSLLAQDELQKNLTFATIAERTPQVAVWPGDRNGTSYVVIKRLPLGGVRVTVPYTLRNGCRACDALGSAVFAFDFERSGRYLGTKLLGVTARKAIPPPARPQ